MKQNYMKKFKKILVRKKKKFTKHIKIFSKQ